MDQWVARLALMSVLVAVPVAASAQAAATGSIGGVVRDSSGAVLPGVTVEASSPALIEKVRVAVSDAQGNYKIVDLRPGVYTVTFTLTGFSTYKREGIELTTGFNATANAEMKVGSLEETIVVTGASPVVDVQNVRQQKVLTQDVIDSLPVSKAVQGMMALTLGAVNGFATGNQDVGGNQGEQPSMISFHGARGDDMKRKLDGMPIAMASGNGGGVQLTQRVSVTGIQEVVLETGSNAENETGGVQLNYVPKEGSNSFRLYVNASYANDAFQGTNLDDHLRSRGVLTAPEVKQIWDYGVGLGGPILKDKVWFYSANRLWGSQEFQPGAYFNKTVGTLFYTPDLDRPAYSDVWVRDFSGRITWQAAAKHKVTVWEITQKSCRCTGDVSSILAPEASTISFNGWNHVLQGTWSYPATSRLLFQGSLSLGIFPLNQPRLASLGVTTENIGLQELSTGLRYNARAVALGTPNDYGDGKRADNYNEHASVSYVTGSHSFKAGLSLQQGRNDSNGDINQAISYTFRNQLPVSLTQWAAPEVDHERTRSLALYGQDQWKIGNVTLNYGLRFDAFNGRTLADRLPPARFVGERVFAAVENVPDFTDVSPRLGVAYDLFGNGKTAVKASLGRYLVSLGAGIAQSVHPALAIVSSTTRTWDDVNGNYVPDCDLLNRASNGECGAFANNAFGTTVVNTRRSPEITEGLGNREFNWQTAVSVQHELRPGVGLNVGYFRTWYGNFTVIDNRAVTPAEYDTYCITAPVDARLPGGGGNQLCGLYDIQRASFGRVDNLITETSNFGERKEIFSGVDIGVNARFRERGLVSGGVSLGQQTLNTCVTVDSPQDARQGFCGDVPPPWSAGTQFKLAVIYPLPWWGLQPSLNIQNLPGVPILATYVATNAEVARSLGRNLAACPSATGACTATANVPLIAPASDFEDRLTQVDLRITKVLRIGGARIRGNFDIANMLNANTILRTNTTYGASWLRPTAILGARLFKVGAEVDF